MALVALALPTSAGAEELVPPDNSAANQYTEAYPTTGGNRDTRGPNDGHPTLETILGPKKTQALEGRGSAGEATAALVAATNPFGATPVAGTDMPGFSSHRHGVGLQRSTRPSPNGSSGIGEVFNQATGLSGDGFGALLPTAIFAALLWGTIYFWRHRSTT